MHQNTTHSTLTPKQDRALDHLVAGKSITAAAKAVKVDRSTLHRWLRDDHCFIAAHNQRRRELRERHQTRLTYIATKAFGTVEKAIQGGDVAISMKLLSGLGFLPGEEPWIGPDNPREVELEQRNREERINRRQALADLADDLCSSLQEMKFLLQLLEESKSHKRDSGQGRSPGEDSRISPDEDQNTRT